MEQLHFITKLLDIKDPNIQILDIINKDTHKEIIAKLDYDAPSCPECGNQLKKYDFQKPNCDLSTWTTKSANSFWRASGGRGRSIFFNFVIGN
ncbi:IS1167 transposase [Streptococcus pneumoniae]|nr:IS1167 transposase [Streptococcus pneumoniae]